MLADRGGSGAAAAIRLAARPGRFLSAVLIGAAVASDREPALDVLDRLRASPAHMVLVYDEHGHFEGLITPMHILGAIAGDFDRAPDEVGLVRRPAGSMRIAGWLPADAFADRLDLTPADARRYATVAGLLRDALRHIPKAGEQLDLYGARFEIVDMDGARIDQILVTPAA